MARRPCRYGKLKHPVGRRKCKKRPWNFPKATRAHYARSAGGKFAKRAAHSAPMHKSWRSYGPVRSASPVRSSTAPRSPDHRADERVRGSFKFRSDGSLPPSDERIRGRYRATPEGKWELTGGRRRKRRRR